MAVVQLSASRSESESSPADRSGEPINWFRVAAAGALAASGVLLMTGKRRAGLAVAVSGTALALLDQQETVRAWWNKLPEFLEETQHVLACVQGAVEEISSQSEKLRAALAK
jgi:hypothetical protein